MNDYNDWISLAVGAVFVVSILGLTAFFVLREVLLDRAIMRMQVTTPAERAQGSLAIESARRHAGRLEAVPTDEPKLLIDLDALEA